MIRLSLILIAMATLFGSTEARASSSFQAIRDCERNELRAEWMGTSIPPGTTYAYRAGNEDAATLATRVEYARGSVLVTRQPAFYDPKLADRNFYSDTDKQKDIFGFLPMEAGSPKSPLYRQFTYSEAVRRVWSAPPKTIVEGQVQEDSTIFGKRRVIHGPFRTMILGCADLAVGRSSQTAKVFRVVMPVRTVNARVRPPVETIKINDFRYFISLKNGVVLRQETASGPIQMVSVIAPGEKRRR